MEKINEKFDIVEYCSMLGMNNVDVYVNGSGMIFLIVDDGCYNFECEIGNTGETAYCVKIGYRKPSTIISIKSKINKILLDMSNEI